MRGWSDLPLFVVLMGLGALAMLVPVLHAVAERDWLSGRAFFYSALLLGIFTTLVGLATHGRRVRNAPRSQLLTLVGAYTVLPAMLAVPLAVAVPTAPFLDLWVETVSALTTTGATLFEADALPNSVHLWRALLGWLGGLFIWVVAIAILAPMNLGGFEVMSGAAVGVGSRGDRVRGQRDAEEMRLRLIASAQILMPIYALLTLVLWLGLIVAGDTPFVAVCHAMSTLATSGISPIGGVSAAGSGVIGEALVMIFLTFALSRSAFARDALRGVGWQPLRDPEIRVAVSLLVIVPGALFLRHWIAAFEENSIADFSAALGAIWGAVFTVLSFLTTTGFVSASWETSTAWSGLSSPGIALMALALVGGGVATTAGGLKLLRVYALYKHGERELNRLVYPHSVGGKGPDARRLRGQGAYVSWVFFMLFTLAFAGVTMLLSLTGLSFDEAQVLAIASLTNCGPVAAVVLPEAFSLTEMSSAAKLLLSFAMVLGRLETLAIVALFNPAFWRA